MATNQMVINYVPGEECRVAIVEDNKLEELHVERFANASRVGNIYVGRVNNVEPAIQAAFVDFGVNENGFLHVSDLHPRYFPGEDMDETTERVGHKTPRRERPPIQHALRRGQEVIVQVLKEGVGTKGPTLTSYLSIPGRFLVMMPQMDKVGVSRKVEDEQLRHQMREILDQLDLPEGFGFILRTAGMERTKTELKRDLAYLQRLWKDMERRLKTGNKPRLLYSESDLLVRSLRDLLTAEITEVVIDHEAALKRAARFMKIVAPRGQAKLLHYPSKAPIFHAFGIEQQIAMIHAREVPLPSGGRLVIDQTEALVAIDVNSGKSRDARDAERNAFQTNLEAVDEICRQLRLRDLGGIVVNDLIDMREARHRRDVESRFRERLKRDRARSTTASISPFGILEMTRQRMRGSHESLHFVDCPTCRGRGLVQKPDSVAADALRDLAALLDIDKVGKVEMVVAPRVAGELLSTKRLLLNRIERASGKHVDVRVSEAVAVDRITFYAYDTNGNDIDLATLPAPRKPNNLVEYDLAPSKDEESWASDIDAEKAEAATLEAEHPEEPEAEEAVHPIEIDEPDALEPAGEQGQGEGGRRRRRRRRRGRGRGGNGEGQPAAPGFTAEPGAQVKPPPGTAIGQPAPADADGEPGEGGQAEDGPGGAFEGDQGDQGDIGPDGQRRKRRRRRRRGRGRGGDQPPGTPVQDEQPERVEAEGPDDTDEWGEPPAPKPIVEVKPGDPDVAIALAEGSSQVPPPSLIDPEAMPDVLVVSRTPDEVGVSIEGAGPGEDAVGSATEDAEDPTDGDGTDAEAVAGEAGAPGTGKRRRRRRRGRGKGGPRPEDGSRPEEAAPTAPAESPRPQPAGAGHQPREPRAREGGRGGHSQRSGAPRGERGEPRGDHPRGGNPRAGRGGGHPRDGHPRDGHPRDGHPRDSRPRDGQSRDGHPRGEGRSGHSDQRTEQSRSEAKPPATPPPASSGPRSLYSTRRKLSPSERNKRPKPE